MFFCQVLFCRATIRAYQPLKPLRLLSDVVRKREMSSSYYNSDDLHKLAISLNSIRAWSSEPVNNLMCRNTISVGWDGISDSTNS